MNKPSSTISPEDNRKVFEILGRHKQSVSTAVVQLFEATDTSPRSWKLVVTGVACFVRDSAQRGFYIQVVDMDNDQIVWEQALHPKLKYNASCDWFHTFEIDNGMIGISFADDQEAVDFKAAVAERIEKRRARAEQRRLVEMRKHNESQIQASNAQPTNYSPFSFRKWLTGDMSPAKRVIGNPVAGSFVHVTGIKPSGQGLQMIDNTGKIDPKLKEFLRVAGLSESILQDPNKTDEIIDFVNNNGDKICATLQRKPKVNPRISQPNYPPKPTLNRLPSRPAVPPPPPSLPPPTPPPPPPPPPINERTVLAKNKETEHFFKIPNAPVEDQTVSLMDAIREAGGNKGDFLRPVPREEINQAPKLKAEDGSLTDILKIALERMAHAKVTEDTSSDNDSDWSKEDC